MEPKLLVGACVGERYTLVRVLGAGAMGSVFEADDGQGARVALKALDVPRGKKDAVERRARFLREAAVSASLVHRHIVPVVDHGIDGVTDIPYLVMPLLAGSDLGRVLERCGALEPEVAVALAVQACEGLAAAHAAGIVHRDIKPSNLFLDIEEGEVTLKIADFGLAKVFGKLEGALTRSGAFMGAAHYVSPEQATNAKHVDARSDVWSVAMTLYHALSGEPAFSRTGSFMALVLELTGSGVRPLQGLAPWVSPHVARAVHGALLGDVSKRCPSASELSLSLDMAAGIDVSRGRIRESNLAPVSAATRAGRAPVAVLPESWDDLLRG